MLRLLLLIPTTTYRTEDFVAAAAKLDVELVVASERPNVLEAALPDNLLTLDFDEPLKAARTVAEFARRHPVNAVVPVDDRTTVVGAAIAERLGLRSSSLDAVSTTRNKHRMREAFARAGVRSPRFTLLDVSDDPEAVSSRMTYPCVLKPTILAGSRGVIRADDVPSFVAAFRRVVAILQGPDTAGLGKGREEVLVEDFIPGREVALEGLLVGGELHVLALFDKPDPLDGPYFEETIYVTPSRLAPDVQQAITAETRWAARALGLTEGPVHAELRVNEQGPWVVEVAARTIGGLCSRTLRFGAGLSLEELVIRHALGIELDSLERERRPAGVMMAPDSPGRRAPRHAGPRGGPRRPGHRGGDDQRPRRPGAGPVARRIALPRLPPGPGGFPGRGRGRAPRGSPPPRVRRRPARLGRPGRRRPTRLGRPGRRRPVPGVPEEPCP